MFPLRHGDTYMCILTNVPSTCKSARYHGYTYKYARYRRDIRANVPGIIDVLANVPVKSWRYLHMCQVPYGYFKMLRVWPWRYLQMFQV